MIHETDSRGKNADVHSRSSAADSTRRRLRTIAFRAFCAAAVLSILVALLGTIVATYRSF